MEQQQGDTNNDSSAPVLRHRCIKLREFHDNNNTPCFLSQQLSELWNESRSFGLFRNLFLKGYQRRFN
jgi:hypothetical protein